jgi:hypothetical protein
MPQSPKTLESTALARAAHTAPLTSPPLVRGRMLTAEGAWRTLRADDEAFALRDEKGAVIGQILGSAVGFDNPGPALEEALALRDQTGGKVGQILGTTLGSGGAGPAQEEVQ